MAKLDKFIKELKYCLKYGIKVDKNTSKPWIIKNEWVIIDKLVEKYDF